MVEQRRAPLVPYSRVRIRDAGIRHHTPDICIIAVAAAVVCSTTGVAVVGLTYILGYNNSNSQERCSPPNLGGMRPRRPFIIMD